MTLIKVTLNLAFADIVGATEDAVTDKLVAFALDHLEAEVAFTGDASERAVSVPDIDMEAEDADANTDVWQDRAHEELAK